MHLSELTGPTIPIVMRNSLLIKTIQPDQSDPKVVCKKEMFSSAKRLEKAYFSVKMTGPAIVGPASSYFWKVPLIHVTKLVFYRLGL